MTTLSFASEWVSRGMTQVFALKLGMDWFNATIHEGEYADSDYMSWLVQMQWFKRFSFLNSALLFKTNFQLSDDPIPVGKFSLGGASTVRGYRENHMTTDSGLLASAEW